MAYTLNSNDLESYLCTITDYVIEWRLNSIIGTIVLISGNIENPDPAIQAYHPLIDIGVPVGTLYPIIRYAYIGGIKYTAYYEEGASYSPSFLECLDPIVIDTYTTTTTSSSTSTTTTSTSTSTTTIAPTTTTTTTTCYIDVIILDEFPATTTTTTTIIP